MQNLDSLSKFLSLILRHKPEIIGIKLDKNGWADVEELISGVNRTGRRLTYEMLKEIVLTDNKQRYSFSDNHLKIRANQGHSINVDVELKEKTPPDVLYHGTADKSVASIFTYGLLPQSRLYVHLSSDKETALKVGARHGDPAILVIAAGHMAKDGYKFYLSENNVWLTKTVPAKYIWKMTSREGLNIWAKNSNSPTWS